MSGLDPFIVIDQLRVKVFEGDVGTFNNLTVTGLLTAANATITNLSLLGNLNMNGFRVINMGPPINPNDAATKQYVDSIATSGVPAGLNTQVQYNSFGMFAADANFTWRTASQVLAVSGAAPAVVIGSQTPDIGPALQLKTNLSPGTIAVLTGPSQLFYQTSLTTVGAGPATLFAFQLTDRTAAYCDVVVTGITTAGAVGGVGAFRRRFFFKVQSGTVTVSTVTTDFENSEVAGMDLLVAGAGSVLNVNVVGTGNTHVWSGQATLSVTGAWP